MIGSIWGKYHLSQHKMKYDVENTVRTVLLNQKGIRNFLSIAL